MKIWIVTARFGQGHFSAARSLEEKYKARGYEVVVSDVIELLYPFGASMVYGAFNHIICRNAAIYNFLNEFGRNPDKEVLPAKQLKEAFDEIQPDAVITTWSACARMLGSLPVPTFVCVTDLGVHAGWVAPHVQGYLVATQSVADQLVEMKVPEGKIHISGIPVKKVFETLAPEPKTTKKVLIMGGGLGILPWVDSLLKELSEHPEIKITVIAGRNRKLYRKLYQRYPSATIIGFTSKVAEYLAQADLLVSKPGGVTLFESIYAETPCLAVFPSYKHEIENAKLIQTREIGDVVWQGESLCDGILKALENEEKRCLWQKNMQEMKTQLQAQQRKEPYLVEDSI